MAFHRFFSDAPSYSRHLHEPMFGGNLFDDDFFFGPIGSRRAGDAGLFFPVSWEPEVPRAPANRKHKHKNKHQSIPIHVDGPDTKSERKAKAAPASMAVAGKRAPSMEAAAVRLQAAARGFLARRSVQVVREVERRAEYVECVLRESEEELHEDKNARVAAVEVLMGMLLRLDAVRGARDYRRRVTKKVLALQDFVDAHEPKAPVGGEATAEGDIAEESVVAPVLTPQDAIEIKAAPATAAEPEVAAEETGAVAAEATVVVEIAEEAGELTEFSVAAEHSGKIDVKAAAEMEVDGELDDANPDADKADGSDVDAEWEILKDEEHEVPACSEAPRHEPPARQEIAGSAAAGAGIADMGKLMEMVTALCERMDALERTVRRMEGERLA